MNLITVAVVANDSAEELKYTLESIVAQSTEDFDVIAVCGVSPEDVKAAAQGYADEYVGFTVLECSENLIPQRRNFAAANAKTEYVMFIDAGDYLAPESIEKIIETAKEKKTDIITTRYYVSGEGEPYYEHWNDLLATVPDADRFDRALLNSLDTDGRVFKKKFFDLYGEGYPASPVFYNASFTAKCVFDYGASVTGCAGATYDRRHGIYADGFADGAQPTPENLRFLISLTDRLLESAASIIKETTGAFDGDEYAYQELLSVSFRLFTDNFYRLFWHITDEMLAALKDEFEKLTDKMTADRKKKISEEYMDIRFPSMYMTHADAVKMPMFSLLADFGADVDPNGFLASLYVSRFPFFELFLREGARGAVESRYADMPNLHFLPDKDFFTKARAESKGIQIAVKDASPLDIRTLSELSVSKAPRGLFQYLFGLKRKRYSAKTYLKKKGLNMK